MISVALATYNGEMFILEQLASILNQTLSVDEVVITDDCSTDNTVCIIREFIAIHKLNNWYVFVNETTKGFSSNFFGAVKKTKGDYIFLSDQDDVWKCTKVEVMISLMNEHQNIFLLSSNFSLINKKGRFIVQKKEHNFKANKEKLRYMPLSFFIGNSNLLGCSMCIRKELRLIVNSHKNIELNKSLGHDWYFSMVANVLGDFAIIDEKLFRRRIHGGNSSMVGLKKTTLLSSTKENRIVYFEQIINAHKLFICNPLFEGKITNSNISKLKEMIKFYKRRLSFTKSKNIYIWLLVLFSFKKYVQCAKTYRGAIKMFIGDFLYAFNINWKISNNK